MSWILGIDTSSVDLGIGLYDSDTPVASYSRYVRNSHAEHITQVTKMMLVANSIHASDINHIAVSVGPGSFTGLRIGLAFVKGLVAGRVVNVLPVSSLEVLAHAAIRENETVLSAIDARNGDVFWARFSFSNGIAKRNTEDSLTTVDVFKENIGTDDLIVTDTMGFARSTVFSFLETNTRAIPVERYPLQRGLFCARLGACALTSNSQWTDAQEILPNYLRSSSAQRALKATAS